MRFDRPYDGAPRFGVGQRVRASLPDRSATRGRRATCAAMPASFEACHGAHVVPDESAEGREVAEPLYTVTFMLADLFPERSGSADRVSLDLWERYLEPA